MQYFDFAIYGGDWGLLFLRVAVAAVFLSRGLQKRGMWKTAPSEQMPSYQLALMRMLSIVEPIVALSILFGVLAPLGALTLSAVMLGAMYFKIFVWKKRFSEPGGWEFDVTLFAALLVIAALGAGVFSLSIP